MCMYVYMYAYVYHVQVWFSRSQKEASDYRKLDLETVLSAMWVWKLNPGSL